MMPDEPKFTPIEEVEPVGIIHHLAGWEVVVTPPKGMTARWGVQHIFLDIVAHPEHGLPFPTRLTLECGVEDDA